MVRMKDEILPKRSETKKQEGCRKRGRPQLRREDCLKRDIRKAEEEKRRGKSSNEEQLKKVTEANPNNATFIHATLTAKTFPVAA